MATTGDIAVRLLRGEQTEMAALQRVLEGAPRYFEIVTASPAGSAEAQSMYSVLPDGKSYDDKFLYGIYCDLEMVGCADVIRFYPDQSTAFLGLLLIAEPFQCHGIGRAAFLRIEEAIRAWDGCKRVRLSVVKANEDVIPFWRRLGFVPTGEIKPYRHGSISSEHIMFEKELH